MRWIGTDESGKGDYFGYLVVAGVVVDDKSAGRLKDIGVKDSKMLSDQAVQRIGTAVKKICPHDVVKVSPERYNQMHAKYGNMNKILAWCHARAIANLAEKHAVDHVVVDKFADENVLNTAISENPKFEKIKKARIIQKVRGESDIAVAAASVVARAEFLKMLRALSIQVGVRLPKGAAHLEGAIREIRGKYSDEVFSTIAKTHFKTTKKLVKK